MALNLGTKATNLIRLRDDFSFAVPKFGAVPFGELVPNFTTLASAVERTVGSFLSGDTPIAQTTDALDALLAEVVLDQTAIQRVSAQNKHLIGRKVSFRTSAALEDGAQSSFAGQYESFLDVECSEQTIGEYTLKCLASMVAPKVLTYSKSRGLTDFIIGGSVIIQEMFYGKASGVLFTENGRGQLLIAVSDSWRNRVVEGEDAREITVDRTQLSKVKLPWQLRELCQKALQLEFATESPVDVEWAYDGTQLVFLQFRPITQPSLEFKMDWDSTNISENYPGITLPLTYSLIRQFYAGVYLAFFKMLGASNKTVEDKRPIADNMLGYLNGRVYYRISNWYEAVKLLPGRSNQEFFEAMLNPVAKRGAAKRGLPDPRSLLTMARFGWLLLRSERISRRFSKNIAAKIAYYDAVDFGFISAAAILDASKRLRKEILTDWAVTILNDIRLMVFHGLLKRAFAHTQRPDDYMLFMQGLSDRASIKPLAALTNLGRLVAQALEDEGVTGAEDLVGTASWPAVKLAASNYVSTFGARTPGELKLENRRLTDDVHDVLALALKAAESGIDAQPAAKGALPEWPGGIRATTKPWIRWVAKNTKQAIDWRERFRFNRAQTFNLSRKAFDAIGAVLTAEGMLEDSRDIYWLTDPEIDELVNGHAPVLSGLATVAARKAEFAGYERLEQGLAVSGAGLIAAAHLTEVEPSSEHAGLNGNGVAPGQVTAEAVVVLEFDPKIDVRGKVLVVHYIDPGWTLLFTQAAAIVSERGNALSHAAIIAREIGIPAVVGAVRATTQIQTGQTITVNGTTGSIKHESL